VAPEPEGSSPHSQQPATGPCPKTNKSTPHPRHQQVSPRSIMIPSYHLRLDLPSGLFPLGFPSKNLYTFLSSPMRATCPAHHNLLDSICLMIFRDEYKLWSSSLCSLLHSSVTSSLLGPDILLRSLFSNSLSLSLPLTRETRFHTHTKQAAEYSTCYAIWRAVVMGGGGCIPMDSDVIQMFSFWFPATRCP
jgi:hypothetical protein